MMERPAIEQHKHSKTFLEYYYLKAELMEYCRKHQLPVSGGKVEITNRIAHFLDTGSLLAQTALKHKAVTISHIDLTTRIESDITCTEKHRAFFKEHLGKQFSFNVTFQRWLKNNAGKTYNDALQAYEQILKDKKKGTTSIDKQFEYNTYIRDFFADNKGQSLAAAIFCWTYKKKLPGHNRYEKADLMALAENIGSNC